MAQVMFTKDGSRVGNGIMFKSDELGPLGSSRYHVETDFGNFMILNYNELFDYYTCGPQTSYEQWRADRLDLRLCSSMEEHLPVEQRDAGSVPVTTATLSHPGGCLMQGRNKVQGQCDAVACNYPFCER